MTDRTDTGDQAEGVGPSGVSTRRPWRTRLRAFASPLLRPKSVVLPLERGWVLPVLVLWGAGRAVNLAFLYLAYTISRGFGWSFGPQGPPRTSFTDFLCGWDGGWFGAIATMGYSETLPLDAQGRVTPNSWAFLPVYPFLERALAQVTGIPWQTAGVLINLAASAAACLVLYALLRAIAPPKAAWWALVLFSFGPVSFVMVLGYAEGVFLLLLFGALLLAVRRRYVLIAPLGLLAAFTRPGALALALTLGIILGGRWMTRTRDPFPRTQVAGLVFSGLSTAVAGFAWPVIATVVTGHRDAYVLSETAWWVPFLRTVDIVPVLPGIALGWLWAGALGVLVVLAVVAATFRWIFSRRVRRLGLEVFAFAFSYTLYLFTVYLPTQSVPRLVLPLTPLLADGTLSKTHGRRAWSLTVSLVLQLGAVFLLWVVGNP